MCLFAFVCFCVHVGRCVFCFYFFFQAEDGIRDKLVTGVQTCALPILADTVLLKELAGQTGLSPSRFGRAFKLSMGISPHRWQMNLRVLEAQEMLREDRKSVV